ncbi:uncharacterized protein [Aegilops tauschii subsp. strangulata]|uniref:uncharacterized protein n=1 Tax=Aegilops tauschii subsp. strangulata TaxID=200361 RepID=UPI00098BCB2E
MASPHSAASLPSNPFEGPAPPPVEVVRDLDIFARVPVVLDYATSTYYAWKTYFSLVFREYHLIDHVDGSVDSGLMFADDDWLTIDATITRWLYQTISKDIFHTIVCDTDDAQTVWAKLNGLFPDNALQRRVFLQHEFFGCHQLDSSIDDYCMRLKKHADELRDLGERVSDDLLLSTLTAGLNEEFDNAASNLTFLPDPTFPRVVAYLRLEERRMKMVKSRATHTALAAGTSRAAPPTAPQPPPPASYFQAPPAPDARTRMVLHRCDSPDGLYR